MFTSTKTTRVHHTPRAPECIQMTFMQCQCSNMAWLFGDVGVRNLNQTNGRSVRVIPALLLNIFHHILQDYVQTAINWSQHCCFCTKVMDSSHCNNNYQVCQWSTIHGLERKTREHLWQRFLPQQSWKDRHSIYYCNKSYVFIFMILFHVWHMRSSTKNGWITNVLLLDAGLCRWSSHIADLASPSASLEVVHLAPWTKGWTTPDSV